MQQASVDSFRRRTTVMARVCVSRTSGVFLLLFLITSTCTVSPPWIFSVNINDVSCVDNKCVFDLNVSGDFVEWSITSEAGARGELCDDFAEPKKSGSNVIEVPKTGKWYFCANGPDGWRHQLVYLDASDVSERSNTRWDVYNLICFRRLHLRSFDAAFLFSYVFYFNFVFR